MISAAITIPNQIHGEVESDGSADGGIVDGLTGEGETRSAHLVTFSPDGDPVAEFIHVFGGYLGRFRLGVGRRTDQCRRSPLLAGGERLRGTTVAHPGTTPATAACS